MKIYSTIILLLLLGLKPVQGQEYWTLLHEYPSPANYALGLYYDGKLLWHVDWDSSTGSHTVYTLNPYNLQIIDVYPSPIIEPWGITNDGRNFWMCGSGINGQAHSQLARILPDTFAVETIWDFDGYYFYGITYDSVGGHLWIANQTSGWVKFFLEFDPVTCEVVDWHYWTYGWTTGLHYFDGKLWAQIYDWTPPDYTYIVEFLPWVVQDVYVTPDPYPEGIATNGIVWWIAYWRNNHHCIQKLVPPGTTVHDIAAHSPFSPPGSGLHLLS